MISSVVLIFFFFQLIIKTTQPLTYCLLYFQNHLLPHTLCRLPMNTSHWVSFEKYPTHYKPISDTQFCHRHIFRLETHIIFKKLSTELVRLYLCSPSLPMSMRSGVYNRETLCKHTTLQFESHIRYLFLMGLSNIIKSPPCPRWFFFSDHDALLYMECLLLISNIVVE